MTKTTTEISKMISKKYQKIYRRAPCRNSKKRISSKLANCLNIAISKFQIVSMYTHTAINLFPQKTVCAGDFSTRIIFFGKNELSFLATII